MTHEKQVVEPRTETREGEDHATFGEGGSVSGHLKGGGVRGYDAALGVKREAWSPS
jgi:hypothetical protein